MQMKTQTYTIEQLCELTGFPRRTIRYYVQEGIVEPPSGRGRGGFYYDSQLMTLMRIKKLQNSGLKLADIRIILESENTSAKCVEATGPSRETVARYQLAEGVELLVTRSVEEAEQKRVEAVVRLARSILEQKEK